MFYVEWVLTMLSPCFHVHPNCGRLEWAIPDVDLTVRWGDASRWKRATLVSCADSRIGGYFGGFFGKLNVHSIFQQKYSTWRVLNVDTKYDIAVPVFMFFHMCFNFRIFIGVSTPLLEFGTSSDHTLNISLLEEPTKDSLRFELRVVNYFNFSQICV